MLALRVPDEGNSETSRAH